MNNRLQQFLEFENLTPARLADMLGVQRSGLSHILSGRNKPGYEFIHKLLTRFPAINAVWLITGKGKPYKEMDRPLNNGNSPTEPSSEFQNLFNCLVSKFLPATKIMRLWIKTIFAVECATLHKN